MRVAGVAKLARFLARSASKTPRAREQAVQTWMFVPSSMVFVSVSASGAILQGRRHLLHSYASVRQPRQARRFAPHDLLPRRHWHGGKCSLHCTPCVSVSSRLQCKHWLSLRLATLQENKHKEGVHLVVPPEFASFFIAGASAGAALVGLLFVAVSIAPEQIVTRRAPIERQAVARSAFTPLINAFFPSLAALIPRFNFGPAIVPICSLSLVPSLTQPLPPF